MVAVVSGGLQCHVLEVVDGGGAGDATHDGVGAVAGNGVLVDDEVGYKGGVADRCHGESGSGALLVTGNVGPVHEVVAVVSLSHEVAILEVLHADRCRGATHDSVVDIGCHSIDVGVEVGHQVAGAAHREAVGGGGGNGLAAFGPVHEVVAGGWSSRQCGVGEVVVVAGSGQCAACGRYCRNCDVVVVDGEGGGIGGVAVDGDGA